MPQKERKNSPALLPSLENSRSLVCPLLPQACDLEALGKLKVFTAENTISMVNLEGMLIGMKWQAVEAKYKNDTKTNKNYKQK